MRVVDFPCGWDADKSNRQGQMLDVGCWMSVGSIKTGEARRGKAGQTCEAEQ